MLLKFILQIIRKKIKIKFNKIQNSKILIFDGTSIQDLEFLLEKYEYAVLENRLRRIKEVNLSLKTSFELIKNLFSLILERKKISLSNLYLYTIIKLVKPKVIITGIDNSLQFHQLAKLLHEKIVFFAIQNANRVDYLNNEYNIKNSLSNIDYNSQIFIPNLICFGDAEEKLAKKLNLNIKKFLKYGSIRTANFFYYINKEKKNLLKNLYDVCLISEPVDNFNEKYKKKGIEEGLGNLARYKIKFAIEKNLKFTFASKYTKYKENNMHNKEIEFYKKHLNQKEFNYLIKNLNEEKHLIKNLHKKKHRYSSYLAIFQSKVVIGCQSTLLRDKIGLREKILSSNLTDYENFNFPIDGICTINNCSYDQFSLRLSKILSIDTKTYFENLNLNEVMMYDENNNMLDKVRLKINENL